MTIDRRRLKVKVIGQANAVGPTSIEDSAAFYSSQDAIAVRNLLDNLQHTISLCVPDLN